jgi:hypothetical protein
VLGELVMAAVTESAYARSMAQSAPGISAEQARAAAKMVTPAAKRMALRHYRALDSANFRGWEEAPDALAERLDAFFSLESA